MMIKENTMVISSVVLKDYHLLPIVVRRSLNPCVSARPLLQIGPALMNGNP